MKPRNNVSLSLLLYGYAVFLGALYIFAFWRPYGFNVFPYLSASDFITSPLNRIWVLLAPLAVLILLPVADAPQKPRLPFHWFVVALAAHLYLAIASIYQSFHNFFLFEFSFENEKSVLALCTAFVIVCLALAYGSYRNRTRPSLQAASLVLAQISLVMAIGYNDGKSIFNGASNVYFLENRELCSDPGPRDWVYVARFGSNAFFLNTIDKRLCVSDKLRFNLVSRKFAEGL